MKYLNKIIVVLIIVAAPLASFGQYCNSFHEKYCLPSEIDAFKPNGQSKSALFAMGQTSELNIIVYKGQDYRISLCMDENLGTQIKFKIYETVKKKVETITEITEMEEIVDEDGESTGEEKEVIRKETQIVVKRVKELLYDNSTDDYSVDLEFTVETTRRLTIEISVPNGGDGSGEKAKRKSMKSSNMGCVGILVEHMSTPISGFYGTGF